MSKLGAALSLLVTLAATACDDGSNLGPSAQPSATQIAQVERESAKSWIKDRFIPVAAAVNHLQAHVDVAVVLPRDRLGGVPNYRGWFADPKYLHWGTGDGIRYGTMRVIKKDKVLILDFGLVSFDGCGGTDMHIPTHVLGESAMLYVSPDEVWSSIVWPMAPLDTTATYGLSGTFEGWQIRLLAESMSLRAERTGVDSSC